jgi:hypothetical protein
MTMKILVKLLAIFLLLRILGGYAQATSSLSVLSSTETSAMDSAGGQTVDISPVDFVEVINNP